ncbi:penicillin acylase family protein [Robertkochia aurantiaca]|uniref:penicillin acylase family protein n=1 Tax=Robertkochia aurantiaca TaxID=2873700 RepID=UPI00351DA4F1
MRIITRFFLFIAASFGLCLGIAWITLPASADLSYYTEKASDYRVEIIRDSLGIPHIYGETDTDVAFGLGFAHSEDDFATIHDVLLATRGLLASEYGYSAAKTDYVVGFMGVWEAIETNYDEQVPAEIKAIADAYADGVNLYAATRADEFSRFLFPVTGKDIVAGFTFKTPMFYGFDKILGELNDQRKTHELAKTPPLSFQWRETQDLQLGSQGIAIAPHR